MHYRLNVLYAPFPSVTSYNLMTTKSERMRNQFFVIIACVTVLIVYMASQLDDQHV